MKDDQDVGTLDTESQPGSGRVLSTTEFLYGLHAAFSRYSIARMVVYCLCDEHVYLGWIDVPLLLMSVMVIMVDCCLFCQYSGVEVQCRN